MNREEARYASARLAKEVATEIAEASSDPEIDEIAGDVAGAADPHQVSDAHVDALVLAAIKHLAAA